MASIRDDLEGVVTAYDEGGVLVVLAAGDEVPDGVQVGDHVLADGASKSPAKADADGPYAGLKAAELKAEIAKRNDGREDAAKIPAKGAIPVLVAALEADDAAKADADAAAGDDDSDDSDDGADAGTTSGDDN